MTNNTSSRLRNLKKKKEFKNKQPIRSIHMFPEEGQQPSQDWNDDSSIVLDQ